MFHSQMSSWGNLNANFCLSPFLTLLEHEQNPTKTVLVCPKYFFPYSDGLHLTAAGYRWLGEYYAKAYYQQVVQGQRWSPLRPAQITRSNETIIINFTGNVGDLVVDTNRVSDPQGSIYASIFGPSVAVTIDPENGTVILPVDHQLQTGDAVYFHGQAPPDGLSFSLQRYFVRSTPQPNTITLATTTNGAAIDFTDTGSNVQMYLPIRVAIGPFGFEYMDNDYAGVPALCSTTIKSVELVPPAQVRVTLSKIPTGSDKRIRYGYMAELAEHGGFAGPLHGPRGCLRDSDATPSLYGTTLYNWCVHFDKPAP